MRKQIEGSRGVAEAVALCRPEVVCAYPITPQTHIVEALGTMVRTGRLTSSPSTRALSSAST
jgi:pyruvate ferredoxin oxidoreductase alpha subunit